MFLRSLSARIAGTGTVAMILATNFATVKMQETQQEKDEWEKEKEKCPFCKHFLESPCREQFKIWSRCVDKAKADGEDFIIACKDVSTDLFTCTAANEDYFGSSTGDDMDDDNDDVVEEDDDILSDDEVAEMSDREVQELLDFIESTNNSSTLNEKRSESS